MARVALAGILMLAAAEAFAQGDELFRPIYEVLQHPRCTNCHTEGDGPLQRDGRPHAPPVKRGEDGRGVGALSCATCHRDRNMAAAPGAPNWKMPALATPMVFRGRTMAETCRQLLDPGANGGLNPGQLERHFAEDPLLGWAWNPGPARSRPALSRDALRTAIAAWLDAGAPCPP